jgi:hypothetical protein
MNELTDSNLEAYIDATARLLRLPIRREHRPDVGINIRRLAAMAALVAEHPFRIEDEPAPVFHPGKPR